MICGCQILGFKEDIKHIISVSKHKTEFTWEEYKQEPSHWFLNHPCLCFRKSAMLEIGNYDLNISKMIEDFDMGLRMLKHFGCVYNLPEPLLFYRIHDKQVTTSSSGLEGIDYWHKIRLKLIDKYINS
jgi:GT2 family glycosyltransferase